MTRIFFSISLFLFFQLPAWAGSLTKPGAENTAALAIQTFKVQPYEQAVEGFKRKFHGKIHTLCLCDVSDSSVFSRIEKQPPDLILAVGLNALTGIIPVKNIPIIYLMVLDPPAEVLNSNNIYGVSMMVHPDDQLKIIQKTMPWVKNIGILYDAESSGSFVQLAKEFAIKRNLNLINKKTHATKDFIKNLNDIYPKIDAIWMTPDIKLLSSENIEYLLLMTLEKKIPIITFSEKFVELGALMSIGVDATDMGQQAGKLAQQIFLEPETAAEKIVYSEKTVVTINTKISKKIGVPLAIHGIENLKIIK